MWLAGQPVATGRAFGRYELLFAGRVKYVNTLRLRRQTQHVTVEVGGISVAENSVQTGNFESWSKK